MRRIMVLIEPGKDFAYDVQISVIDEGGEESVRPEWQRFSWLAIDLTGQEKPWRKVLREVAGLAD